MCRRSRDSSFAVEYRPSEWHIYLSPLSPPHPRGRVRLTAGRDGRRGITLSIVCTRT